MLFVIGFLILWVLAYFLLRRQEQHALKEGDHNEGELSSSLFWEQGKREQKAVKSAIAAMARGLDEHQLYREVCEAISRGFHFSHVWVEVRHEGKEFTVPACHPLAFARDGHGVVPSLSKRFVESNLTKTFKNLDHNDDPELMPLQSRGLAFVAGVPLGHSGKAWGVLYLGDAAHREIYHATIESIQVVAEHLSLVIERLRSERIIERQSQLLRTIFKSTADALVIADESGKIVQTNPEFDSLFKQSHDNGLGRELGQYIRSASDPENADLFIEKLRLTDLSIQTESIDWQGRNGEDSFPLKLTVGEYRVSSEGRRWVLWLRDISDVLDREKALNDTRAKQEKVRASEGRLLAKLSYGLRTPLESIKSSSGLLSETNLDEEQREYVESLRDGVGNMVISLGDTLDILESRTRRIALREDPFTLHTVLEDLAEQFDLRLQNRNLTLHVHTGPDVPSAFVGDVERLRQALFHMIEDALSRTRKGFLYLKVEESSRSVEGHNLVFTLSNTGDPPDALWSAPISAEAMLEDAYAEVDIGVLNTLHLIHEMAGTSLAGPTQDGGKISLHLTLPAGEPTSSDYLRIYDNLQATLWGHDDYHSLVLQDLLREYAIESQVYDNLNDALENLRENSGTNNGQLLIVPFAEQLQLIPDLLTYLVEDTLLSGVNLVLVTQRKDRSRVTELFSHGRIFCMPHPYRRRALSQILTSCSGQIEGGEAGHGVVGRFAAPVEKKARVLYVEDNSINRQVCLRLLERWGFRCEVAPSGEAAIELLRDGERIDLILLDCVMPNLDGFATAKAIRSLMKSGNRIPIIGMSQQESPVYQQRCKDAGMDALLLKPLTPTALYRALHKFLA
jgi:PAS domain S-box-containing protein